jgi:hypothetical protein
MRHLLQRSLAAADRIDLETLHFEILDEHRGKRSIIIDNQ